MSNPAAILGSVLPSQAADGMGGMATTTTTTGSTTHPAGPS